MGESISLETMFNSLRVWGRRSDFTDRDWQNYFQVARSVQQTYPQGVEAALESFMKAVVKEPFTGYSGESKPFLLMRVVFKLPEVADEGKRLLYKSWTNWPRADGLGNINLAWPITWKSGKPELISSYEGAEGQPYRATAEYRYFIMSYPFRDLRL